MPRRVRVSTTKSLYTLFLSRRKTSVHSSKIEARSRGGGGEIKAKRRVEEGGRRWTLLDADKGSVRFCIVYQILWFLMDCDGKRFATSLDMFIRNTDILH